MRRVAMLLLVLVAGCATGSFEVTDYGTAEEWAPYQGQGQGEILGHAALSNHSGVKTCAGSEVVAFPATPSMKRIMATAKSSGARPVGNSPSYVVKRLTICDSKGNFLLTGLQPGPWFVTTEVVWKSSFLDLGGWMVGEVTVPASGTAKLQLTNSSLLR